MPRVEVIKNFATAQECAALNNWVAKGVTEKWLNFGVLADGTENSKRLTNRIHPGKGSNPELALQLQQRICQHWGLQDKEIAQTSGGNDGVVVSTTLRGGDVYRHIDPALARPLSTLRCTLLSSAAERGCDLYVDDTKIDFSEGDLACYLVSDWPHYVTENLGDKPRNLWMFGWYVDGHAWESGQIGVQH